MKKSLFIIFLMVFKVMIFAENVITLNNIEEYKLEKVSENEELRYSRRKTKQNFEVTFIAEDIDTHISRELGKIIYANGYVSICNNISAYFAIDDNISLPSIYFFDGKRGDIKKVLTAACFSASSDGRYICYAEPWQIKREKKHDVTYWYIYDCKKGKEVNIINTKQENNWDVGIPKYNPDTNSFIFDLRCDADIMKQIEFFISDYF